MLLPVATSEDVSVPEKPKLRFVERAPLMPKVGRESKTLGNFAILALGGGYLHWDHFKMMYLTMNCSADPKNMFALWRVPPPFRPITCKGMRHGNCEFKEIQGFLDYIVHKLPFLERRKNEWEISERETEHERLLTLGNKLGVVEREVVLSPYDFIQKGQSWGKFCMPKCV
ncbi:unnamed protein product [Nyctereutes procyonoides]|uniref:Large ribosomal subunit protein uL16m n=1 Tax=Nyctereutes procyonoides TaxID=34880 RepID=A0A811Y0J5_NYCPR|nr:unnamed protein product [Nyctereutes procyonoides]